MKQEYETRTLKIIVLPKGESIFCEWATEIEIIDEAAGEYVRVSQNGSNAENAQICINPDEWPMISDAITDMIGECRIGE